MEKLDITISKKDLEKIINEKVLERIKEQLTHNDADITKSINNFFDKLWVNSNSEFDKALDWQIEHIAREAIGVALKELDFENLLIQKAIEILSDKEYLAELAKKKIEASLDLQNYS